jgi:phytoene dehydrogenase-like protein
VLSSSSQAAGADIRTEAEVARIDADAGGSQGVTLGNGEHLEASIVISDLDPRRTLLSLVDPGQLDPEFITAVSNVRARGGVGVVTFALDGLPDPPGGSAETLLAGRVQIGATVIDQERAFDALQRGGLAEQPFLQLTFPSLADSDAAPGDQHVATAWVLGVPDEPESLEDSVTAAIETVLPGFTSRVVGSVVATPSDIEERYGATNGCLFDVDVSLDQALFLRPLPGWYRYRTPLRGLYLCGSGTHAGGGITGLPGRNAARRIIADLKAGKVG